MKGLAAFLAVALALPAPAGARMHAPYRGHRIIPANAAPLDGFTAPSGAYSFRKLKSTYVGPSIRIRRASDNLETDINFLGCTGFTGCPWDEAAAAAHCNATTCFVKTIYDQSGAAFDMTQAAAGSQPNLVFNCWGSLPCVQTSVNTQYMGTAASVAAVAPLTMTGVMERASGNLQACTFKAPAGGNWVASATGVANTWQLQVPVAINATAADAARHSFIGIVNGASSLFRIDATETAGTATIVTTPNVWQIAGAATTTVCKFGEYVVWNGYGLTPTERVVWQTNHKSFWGTP